MEKGKIKLLLNIKEHMVYKINCEIKCWLAHKPNEFLLNYCRIYLIKIWNIHTAVSLLSIVKVHSASHLSKFKVDMMSTAASEYFKQRHLACTPLQRTFHHSQRERWYYAIRRAKSAFFVSALIFPGVQQTPLIFLLYF